MASASAFAQSKTYRVKRGETIESVAQRHGVSVSALIQENPEAAYNFHVGMRLIIPSGNYVYASTEGVTTIRNRRANYRQGKGYFASELEFQYYLIGNDNIKFNCGLSNDYGYCYYLHHNFFMEGLVGYKWYNQWWNKRYENASLTIHNITIPIHMGGHIDVKDIFGLRPFFGPRIDIPISSRWKWDHNSEDAGMKTGVTLEFGLDFQFDRWGIRTKYGLGVGYNKDYNYISIGVTADLF